MRQVLRLAARIFSLAATGLCFLTVLGLACSDNATEPEQKQEIQADYYAPKLDGAPTIDGDNSDEVWQTVPWDGMSHYIWGDSVSRADDFSGRYKIGWTEDKLFFLVEITDDDFSSCVEAINWLPSNDSVILFIDEDQSGGYYGESHQAFSYYIQLDSTVTDFSSVQNREFVQLNNHIEVAQLRNRSTNTWELAVDVYTSAYSESDPASQNPKANLESGKEMGLTVAYSDFDECQFHCIYASAPQLNDREYQIWSYAEHFGNLKLID